MRLPTRTALPSWFRLPVLRWSVAIFGSAIAGVFLFEALGFPVFSRIGMPHEVCYLRDPRLVALHVISDLLIGMAYVSIAITLGYIVYRASQGIPFNWVFLAFGLFIVSCGITHFMEVWVIWEPLYWLSGYIKIITAAASVATAVALFPIVPKLFQMVESTRLSEARRTENEQLNEELERFNYSVAHDLRSPLRGIRGFSQMLREDFSAQLSPDAQMCIDRIQNSAERMDVLISDLLDYATVGRKRLERKPIALDDVLLAATALLESEIQESKGIVLAPTTLPVVIGDMVLLQTIFQNLIGNSLKFVAAGVTPRITITAIVHDRQAKISFVDNGLGIPVEAHDKIFRIFERFHPNHPGTGMGLAIVHRAVERLDGRIEFGPAPERTGTRFDVTVPLAGASRSE